MLIKKPFKKGVGSSSAPFYKAAAGGATTTWDPAKKDSGVSLSGGNLIATQNDAFAFDRFLGVASHSSGKFYFENTLTTKASTNTSFLVTGIGNASTNSGDSIGNNANSVGANGGGGVSCNGSSLGTYAAGIAQGDVQCIAVDLTANLFWVRLNGGAWNGGGSADPATGVGGYTMTGLAAGPYFPAASFVTAGDVWTGNFGASAYAQTRPSGYGNW